MINADIIQHLKQKTDLLKLFEHYGHKPSKHGASYKILCPFHNEETPSLSINVKRSLWQCFGCGAAGDALSLIQKIESLSFADAAKKLAHFNGISENALFLEKTKMQLNSAVKEKTTPNGGAVMEPRTPNLELRTIAKIYHQTFLNNSSAKNYLCSRGITNEKLFSNHQIGFADGSLLDTLRADNKTLATRVESGILLDNHRERFLNCIVFPLFDHAGNVASFYGRHIDKPAGHFYLPGSRSGIFNLKRLQEGKSVDYPPSARSSLSLSKGRYPLIITESIIDALSFINQGLDNVLPLYGTNGFTADHLQLIQEIKPAEIILALDGDDQGQHAAQRLKEKLSSDLPFSFNCHIVVFPDNQDANEFFMANSKNDFLKLSTNLESPANTALKEKNTNPSVESVKSVKISGSDIIIKHAELKSGRLAVTLKIENTETKRFILDTFNLYSQKHRDTLLSELAKLFQKSKEELQPDLDALIARAEQRASARQPEQPVAHVISEADKQAALDFLKNPDILNLIAADYEAIGYTGEMANKQLAYLVMTSRKLKNPLSLVIMSNSAAGKSSLQAATLKFCPTDEAKHFTRLTQQSLYYLGEESIKHKFISIEEDEGAQEAQYSLKTLLSSKVLNVASTSQDPITGKRKADEYKTEGPVAVMLSTTSPELESEMASRTLIITIDESTEQTQRIHHHQRSARMLSGRIQTLQKEAVVSKHRNAQRLLDPALIVINNFASQLEFPSDRLKHRRTQEQYLDLIDTIAFLRQFQKTKKTEQSLGFSYVEVDKADISLANSIFHALMGHSVDDLKPTTRKLLDFIFNWCKQNKTEEFTRRQIREANKWSNTHLHNHLQALMELEYLLPAKSNASKFAYLLLYDGTKQKTLFGLKNPEHLR
jgi:DNA primase catalytic core